MGNTLIFVIPKNEDTSDSELAKQSHQVALQRIGKRITRMDAVAGLLLFYFYETIFKGYFLNY